MDVLKVVQQLRDLAADPQNRATIVRDQGCLPGLVIFLDNGNPKVVLTALEALGFLAQVPSNRPLMKNEVGLLISVRRIINRPKALSEVKSSAQTLHDLLIPPAGSARPLLQSRASRGNSFLGSSNKKAKLITLQIEGMKDLASRKLVEERLLGVKGVISFTFNLAVQRCYLRVQSDLKPEILCQVVLSLKHLEGRQVVKNENGEEVLLSFGPSPEASLQDEKENKPVKLPDYLPENLADPQSEEERAVERSGAAGGGGGWFGAVSSFISNSLYW